MMLGISHGVEDQLDLQHYADFSPSKVTIFKILANFGQKIAKNEKLRFSTISQKF